MWWEGAVRAVQGGAGAPAVKFKPTGKNGKPGRTASLRNRHAHVHYSKDATDFAVLFNPKRYNTTRVYKSSEPSWCFKKDMPAVAASGGSEQQGSGAAASGN